MHNDDYSERLGRMISKTNDSGAQEGRQLETGERRPERKQEETMKRGSIFELNGVPKFQEAIPLALQHVVAMIVGCVTPAIIVAGAVGGGGLSAKDRVILIQASLVISALSTLIQLFPLGKKGGFTLGSGLPMIMGVSFAYVPSMQAIAEGYGISTILGAQIVGGVVAFIMGILVKKIRVFFPPLITGTVVFTIGLSLYPTAINYMAGGTSNPDYGSWQNWLVAFITLAVVTALNHFGKGILKLASILIGIIVGYIVSIPFGMVNLSSVGQAKMFQLPQFMHFGIHFEISACVAIGLLFAINSVQAIGDYSATTIGAMDRVPEDRELQNGIMAYGISNVIGALFGGLPTATYSQKRRYRYNHQGHQPLRPWPCSSHPRRCRYRAEILRTSDNDPTVCSRWCDRIRICFHRNDRYETCSFRRDGLQKLFHRRPCSSDRCRRFSGIRSTCKLPGLGNYDFW